VPGSLRLRAGQTLTIYNDDDADFHTFTADNGAFDSGRMDGGSSFSFTFTSRGDTISTATATPACAAPSRWIRAETEERTKAQRSTLTQTALLAASSGASGSSTASDRRPGVATRRAGIVTRRL